MRKQRVRGQPVEDASEAELLLGARARTFGAAPGGQGGDGGSEEVAAVRASQRVRDEVLTMLLNDIRGPLHNISLTASVIERVPAGTPKGNARLHESVGDIRESLSRVNALLSGVLEVDRVGEACAALDVRPHDARELIDVVVGAIRPLVYARKVRVVAEVRESAGRLECDRVRMIPALAALLMEAVRRTPAGGCVRFTASHAGALHLTVNDGGPHLDGEQVARLLAPVVGDGGALPPLEVYMARRVIELHGGTLEVRPEPSGGMVFDAAVPARYGCG